MLLLCELIQVFFILFFFSIANLLLSKALIRCHHRVSHEDHLEAQVFHTSATKASKTIHAAPNLIVSLHSVVIDVAGLMALSWLHKLDNIGDSHKVASENGTISWLRFIDSITTKNHINGAGHRAWRNITG